jgi:hypothetical protein
MKSASVELDTHLQGEVTMLATCWRVTRVDGQAFHFTDHDVSLPVDLADGKGLSTYKASSSYNRSAIRNDDTLAVDNLDLTGVLDSADIDETELRRGLFDFAEVDIFTVNWSDLSQGVLRMRKGWLGEVTITPSGLFTAELRGLTQAYSRSIGELYSPECRADLGDVRCGVPILPPVVLRSTAYAVGDFVRASPALEGVLTPTLLVHADEDADDSSPNTATATLGAQAAVQTVEKKFGAGSIEFSPSGPVDPTAAVVSYPDIAAYTIGTQQFTIEAQVRFKDLTQTLQIFASQILNTGNQRAWRLNRNGSDIEFAFSLNGSTVTTMARAVTWAVDTWYHVAVTRDASSDIRLFVDGIQQGAVLNDGGSIFNSTAPVRLGAFRSAGFDDSPLHGFVDEFRFIVGTAAYTSGFTPPTAQFLSSSEILEGLLCPDFEDRIYRCATAGTTGSVQPAYDSAVGNTTADGSAVFTAEQAWSRCVEVVAVDPTEPRKKFTVSELTPNSGGSTIGRDHFPDGALDGGVVFWETGPNAGKAMEIRGFTADDGVTIEQDLNLFLDMPFDVEVGDTGRVYRGCLKRVLEDCRDVFDNVDNFRGEPYVPGQDLLYGYPDAKG